MKKVGKTVATLGRMKTIALAMTDREERKHFLSVVKEVGKNGDFYIDKVESSFKQTPLDVEKRKDVESKFFIIMKDGDVFRLNESISKNRDQSTARTVEKQLMTVLRKKKATLDDVDSIIEVYYYFDNRKYSRFIRLFMSPENLTSRDYPESPSGKIKLVL